MRKSGRLSGIRRGAAVGAIALAFAAIPVAAQMTDPYAPPPPPPQQQSTKGKFKQLFAGL